LAEKPASRKEIAESRREILKHVVILPQYFRARFDKSTRQDFLYGTSAFSI
jgi:hypothetical protein